MPRPANPPTQAASPGEDFSTKIGHIDSTIAELARETDLINGSEKERNEFFRKRNALYSQRKYYRKKARVEKLEADRDALTEKNSSVKAENELLERVLHWANDKVKNYEDTMAQSSYSKSVPLDLSSVSGRTVLEGHSNAQLEQLSALLGKKQLGSVSVASQGMQGGTQSHLSEALRLSCQMASKHYALGDAFAFRPSGFFPKMKQSDRQAQPVPNYPGQGGSLRSPTVRQERFSSSVLDSLSPSQNARGFVHERAMQLILCAGKLRVAESAAERSRLPLLGPFTPLNHTSESKNREYMASYLAKQGYFL